MKPAKIVLYNPRADYWTLPLALLSLASYLKGVDRSRYEVVLIDGRLEERLPERVIEECENALAEEGHPLPRRLDEWAAIEDTASPWVDGGKRTLVERFKFYQRVAWARPTLLRAPLQTLARWRCRRDFYALPLEKTMVEWLRPLAPQG